MAASLSSSGIGWAPASLQPCSESGGRGLAGGCSEGSFRGWTWTAHASAGVAATAAATTAATAAEAVAAAAAPTGVQATLWRMGVLPRGGLAAAGGVAGCSGTAFEAASGAPGLAGARPKARSSTSLTRGVEACGDGFALAAIAAAAFTAAIAADAVAAAAARTGVCVAGERSRTGAKSGAGMPSAAMAATSSAEAAPAGARSGSEASCGRGDPCVGDTTGGSSAGDRREGERELVTTSLVSAPGSSASKAAVAVEARTCSSPRGTSPVPVGDLAAPLRFSGFAAASSCDSSDAALNWS